MLLPTKDRQHRAHRVASNGKADELCAMRTTCWRGTFRTNYDLTATDHVVKGVRLQTTQESCTQRL